ncbi:TMV resistance protein N [Eucalyptus grandis]|uniref:TMV resistance protein N n=1 Tax=Eucalyptus grandis TaxID=71139 RepID=UPI00192EE533|nr:TMV resistance protein N [Eucalyptus grandis]
MAASSNLKGNYHVFLSFRGTDVRNNFLGHLYAALEQKGIYTYIDSEELRKGEQITPTLIKAIKDSRIAIIIFSEDYASSQWCLEEVEKIMECKEQRGLTVFPVFYKVDPREVRTPRDTEKLWKSMRASLGKIQRRDEADSIKSIVQEISMQLDQTPLYVAKHPVGLSSRVVELESKLNLESHDVLMIGLWGQGGIGKTTLAKALYNDIFGQFEASCFLANVRETSKDSKDLAHLQEKLLSKTLLGKGLTVFSVDGGISLIQERLRRKEVLLVLDDVSDVKQLNALAGEHEWFGKGSRIIVTTRDKRLLTLHGIDKDHIHEIKTLEDGEALELFNKHAFLRSKEIVIRRDLVDSALHYANGLPLALEVLGSLLHGRSGREWESALNRLAKNPDKNINDVLKLSFDGLEDYAKEIFLDIACFFNGRSMEYIIKVLDSCDFDTMNGVQVLVEKSLITIEKPFLATEMETLQMHDLIQLMGMDIVKQEYRDDPGRRSRLWLCEDVWNRCSKSHSFGFTHNRSKYLGPNAFTNMRRLRLLIMINVHNSFQGPIYLPNELRWFQWPECPFSVLKFPPGPKKLVRLDVRKSNIQVIVDQFKDFKNLKFLYLSECLSMVCMPNLDFCPNLEELDLNGCKNLERAHESVAYHAKLRLLDLEDCSNLHHLPDLLQPKNLRFLNLRGCSKLRRFPNIPDKMKSFRRLFLDGTSIEELPASIENFVSLETFCLSYCKKLVNLPSSIYKLPNLLSLSLDGSKLIKFPKLEEDLSDLRSKIGFPKLEFLNLRGCNLQEVEFLENHSCFPSLEYLNLSENNFAKLPTCGNLHNLLGLDVSECRQLQEIGEEEIGEVSGQLHKLMARNWQSLSKIPSVILSVNRLFCDSVRSKQFWESCCISPLETILPVGATEGEMPQWLLLNKEGYISFTASKDLYEKFLRLAICVIFRVKEGKREDFKLSSYINGRFRRRSFEPLRFPILRLEHVLLRLHAVRDLWGVDPFDRNDSISLRLGLGIKASDVVIVKECGFRLICKSLEDNLEALNQDDELLDPNLFYEIWHHDEETTREEEISADLSDLEKGINHEDNYQTSSKEGNGRDDSSPVDIMADFSVEQLSLNEDNHQSRSEADSTSETETDEEILDDMSWSDLSVEKCRYSEIAPHYMDILPGGDMPEELIIVEGSTISFMVLRDFYDKLLGLALCIVFTVEDGEKEIFFNIVPHLNGQKRNGLSGSLGSFNSNHMWIQYLKPNVLWGVLGGAVDFCDFGEDCLRFSLTLSVSGGTVKKLGYVLRCKQMDDDLKDKQLVNPASIYEMKLKEFFYKFLPRHMERMEAMQSRVRVRVRG